MHDWQELVRLKLSGRGLTREQQNEISTELATHLEEVYEERCELGANDAEAARHAFSEVSNWRKLARTIRRSKQQEGQMNSRTRTLWLPGFASLSAVSVVLIFMDRVGVEPKIFWNGSKVAPELYLLWLMVLPLFGALGAYLSHRAHGGLTVRLAAALFPAIVLLSVFCFSIAVSIMVWRELPIAFALNVFNRVLLPGSALFVGATPFLRISRIGGSTDFQAERHAGQ